MPEVLFIDNNMKYIANCIKPIDKILKLKLKKKFFGATSSILLSFNLPPHLL